jgi:hypothetical protein
MFGRSTSESMAALFSRFPPNLDFVCRSFGSALFQHPSTITEVDLWPRPNVARLLDKMKTFFTTLRSLGFVEKVSRGDRAADDRLEGPR